MEPQVGHFLFYLYIFCKIFVMLTSEYRNSHQPYFIKTMVPNFKVLWCWLSWLKIIDVLYPKPRAQIHHAILRHCLVPNAILKNMKWVFLTEKPQQSSTADYVAYYVAIDVLQCFGSKQRISICFTRVLVLSWYYKNIYKVELNYSHLNFLSNNVYTRGTVLLISSTTATFRMIDPTTRRSERLATSVTTVRFHACVCAHVCGEIRIS